MALIAATATDGGGDPVPRTFVRRRALDVVAPAATAGVGSLPHRNALDAVEFALRACELPTIPSLPRRSPAEAPIAQALMGVAGVTLGQYGTVAVDPARLDPNAPVETDLERDQFVGFRTFLSVASARNLTGPVVWHFTGPISVGAALLKAGAVPEVAFAAASAVVRSHLRSLAAAVEQALPGASQLVILDEPLVEGIDTRGAVIAPDEAVDLLSGAMAAIEPVAAVGLHCCGDIDATLLLDAGPDVLSLPVSKSIVGLAGYLDRFLARGGWIAWGAVATEGPIGVTANRSWHQLMSVWSQLVGRGCDPDRLRSQSILTPQCGLGSHGVAVAERICRTLHDVSRAARSDATATQLLLGR